MNTLIEVKDINKSFKEKPLFCNFNLEIIGNTVHAIIGPNGSGKTTLLRMLTGLYNIDSGQIKVPKSHSMLLENDYLYDDKSGMENLKIFGLYFGFNLSGYEKHANILNIMEHLNKRVSSYSKGMKRKLSILIVIMMNREVVYLDEPTSGVDPISRIEIRKIIEVLKSEGKTIIITSHDLSEVEKVADYITMIKDGELVMSLSSEDLKDQSLEELFINVGGNDEEHK